MTFPPEMRDAFRRREAVLVVGTGCGTLYGQPGWRARLEALAAALPARGGAEVRAMLEREAWAAALSTARDRLGPQAARVMAAMTPAGREQIPGVVTALASAPWRAIITTGFDDTWARAMAAFGEAPVVLSAGEPMVPEGQHTLIHAFGRAARPETMCLAPVDLLERVGGNGLEDLLCDLARTCSFMYVGFQPGDPDLDLFAGRVLGPAALERSHFALVTGSTGVATALFRGSFGLGPIAFAGSLEGGLAVLAEMALEAAGPEAMTPEEATGEMDMPAQGSPGAPEGLRRSIREALDRDMEQERWIEAADGLRRLIDLEPDPGARARLLHARATLFRDVLQDRPQAIALLEKALEADPTLTLAWDALEPLHRGGGGDPAALRRCYARALRVLGKSADRTLALRLWGGVAEVSWSALGDHATAVAAFEAARTLNPDDEGPERALAALYLKMGSSVSGQAVAAHQGLAARAPDEPEPYRVLERLWRVDGAQEKAAWASAVLGQLGVASDFSQTFSLTGLGRPAPVARPLSEPLWESLYHPDEDRVLSTLFAVLAPSLVAQMGEPEQGFPPKKAEAVPAVNPSATRPSRATTGHFANVFAPAALAHVAHALELPAPPLFLVDTPRRPLTVHLDAGGSVVRPALLLDRRFADRAPESDLLFDLARTVALLRPPWFLRFGARVSEVLDLGLRAAFALGGTDQPGSEKREVRRLLQHLREERPDLVQAQVVALASELTHRREPPDLGRWQAAIELSAARAALSITGDLDAALRGVRAVTSRPGGLGPGERVKDLLAFAVSEEHFSVRGALAPDSGATARA